MSARRHFRPFVTRPLRALRPFLFLPKCSAGLSSQPSWVSLLRRPAGKFGHAELISSQRFHVNKFETIESEPPAKLFSEANDKFPGGSITKSDESFSGVYFLRKIKFLQTVRTLKRGKSYAL
jgi:hypothetical protein